MTVMANLTIYLSKLSMCVPLGKWGWMVPSVSNTVMKLSAKYSQLLYRYALAWVEEF
ncbi:hypothetical protein KAM329D_42740 [Aeromonas caviae]|nr:hypothetical protein KAM329D_42740 [Aeromonas caviae]